MKYQETALRYAKALLSISQENNHVDSVVSQMELITKQIQKDEDINYFMTAPVMPAASQKELLKNFFEKQSLREEIQNLLYLLVQKRRFFLLPQICKALQSEVDIINGVSRGVVRTAQDLSTAEQKNIEKSISTFTGKKTQLEFKEDKSVIGGIVANVGSYTFDDSLETQLRLMHQDLIKKESALHGN